MSEINLLIAVYCPDFVLKIELIEYYSLKLQTFDLLLLLAMVLCAF